MANSITRYIDNHGRIGIPEEFREVLAIKKGDPLEIQYNRNGEIIIRKYRKSFKQCCHEWYEANRNTINTCRFMVEEDYTFCIVYLKNSSCAGYAKRFAQDSWDTIIGRVAAYANAMGYKLNKMIGYEE